MMVSRYRTLGIILQTIRADYGCVSWLFLLYQVLNRTIWSAAPALPEACVPTYAGNHAQTLYNIIHCSAASLSFWSSYGVCLHHILKENSCRLFSFCLFFLCFPCLWCVACKSWNKFVRGKGCKLQQQFNCSEKRSGRNQIYNGTGTTAYGESVYYDAS